jgi:hypothetical protein
MPSFGTLKADTLTHSTAGSLDTNFVVNGSAKGHVRISYSSSTPSEDDSFNHSSTTDSGTGFATLNIINSMSSINYTTIQTNGGLATDRYGWGQTQMNNSAAFTANTTSTYVCVWLSYVPNFRDPDRASFVIHGDLA